MPRFVIAASVLMVQTFVVEVEDESELAPLLNAKLRLSEHDANGRARALALYKIEECNVQFAEVVDANTLRSKIQLTA